MPSTKTATVLMNHVNKNMFKKNLNFLWLENLNINHFNFYTKKLTEKKEKRSKKQ